MSESLPPAKFKVEMPDIPGLGGPGTKPRRSNPLLPLIIGFVVLGILLLFAVRWMSRPKPVEVKRVEPTPQIEVPAPPPDPASLLPHATAAEPVVADIAMLAKPWSSVDFFVRNRLTGENVPATVVRLPTGSPTQTTGYWAFSRKAVYGICQLEYITDMDKLRAEYDYRSPTHPLVGNACSRTLYDPLKTASLPGNVWIRGGVVQGSDIRPPFGVEIEIRGKQLLAIRTE
jgi:hypothetical protein